MLAGDKDVAGPGLARREPKWPERASWVGSGGPELRRLRADHAPAILAFELANRACFAASVSDRGDQFYEQFTERHSALLAGQEAGIGACYVLVAGDGLRNLPITSSWMGASGHSLRLRL